MNFKKILSEGLDDTMNDIKNLQPSTSGQNPAISGQAQKPAVMPPVKPFAFELLYNGKSVFKTSEKFKLIEYINKLP